jgi:hypothetical protein
LEKKRKPIITWPRVRRALAKVAGVVLTKAIWEWLDL